MAKTKQIIFYYNFGFTFLLLLLGLITKNLFTIPQLLIILLPLVIYFWGYLFVNSQRFRPQNQIFWFLVSLLLIFNLLSTSTLAISNLIFSKNILNLIISLLYLPFPIYFVLTIIDWYRQVQSNHRQTVAIQEIPSPTTSNITDKNRRQFLKLLSGTGISIFLLSLFNPKQAGAAFFGSVPGPGTVAIKDTTGAKINPAEKGPTDGYKVSKIDDTSSNTYAYYGFVNQTGAWYIQRETVSGVNSGDFQYFKGDTNFASNWSSRASFIYDDFEDIF